MSLTILQDKQSRGTNVRIQYFLILLVQHQNTKTS